MNEQNLLEYCKLLFGNPSPILSPQMTVELVSGQLIAEEGKIFLVENIACPLLTGTVTCLAGRNLSGALLEFDRNGDAIDSGLVLFCNAIDSNQAGEEKVSIVYRELTLS